MTREEEKEKHEAYLPPVYREISSIKVINRKVKSIGIGTVTLRIVFPNKVFSKVVRDDPHFLHDTRKSVRDRRSARSRVYSTGCFRVVNHPGHWPRSAGHVKFVFLFRNVVAVLVLSSFLCVFSFFSVSLFFSSVSVVVCFYFFLL